ncbi:MAG TPA: D-glycero-beta-D-manno-heptose 1-phosphate adenylyltransferase [Elusimicrobia bacterium]|nr:D-glycero-beta-D-manno-heptose 1-phosphate adenylyltransferase [Elusimicrobiota bacterium]
MDTNNKLVSLKKALVLRRALSQKGKTAVFTNGCFDILHAGHIALLEKARSLGDFLFLGVNSDSSVKRLKGSSRPVNCQKDRARVLAALAAVDAVVIFSSDTPFALIKTLKPDILVKGADYKASEIVGAGFAGRTVRIPLVEGRSTTGIIRKLAKGHLSSHKSQVTGHK